VFQALAQARPYRAPMAAADILVVLQSQVGSGKLDARVVACVADNLLTCWHVAMQVRPNTEPVTPA